MIHDDQQLDEGETLLLRISTCSQKLMTASSTAALE